MDQMMLPIRIRMRKQGNDDRGSLKERLNRAERRRKIAAFGLTFPLLVFLIVTFVLPISEMMYRSVSNPLLSENIPETLVALEDWDRNNSPEEIVYETLVRELKSAKEKGVLGQIGTRLNTERSGLRSLFTKTERNLDRLADGKYKENLLKVDSRWGDPSTWGIIQRLGSPYTASNFIAALDMTYDDYGNIKQQPENRRIYISLFVRTFWVALVITFICLVLAYPLAYVMVRLPRRKSNLLMIIILLPFWTSLLVRTTAWIVLLQNQGVINDLLVLSGIINDSSRMQMVHNMTGTLVAMVHILLPFMFLPIYSVMRSIPSSYSRAALSLGANPVVTFWKVYAPLTYPGVAAGSLLVFILSIGYYITPALVGGRTGQLISNFIAFHMQSSLNWGLAAALGSILLVAVLLLYALYNRIAGIGNFRLG